MAKVLWQLAMHITFVQQRNKERIYNEVVLVLHFLSTKTERLPAAMLRQKPAHTIAEAPRVIY